MNPDSPDPVAPAPEPQAGPPLRVQVLRGPEQGRTVLFEQGPIRFGRAPENEIVIDDPVVSRVHGELLVEDGRWLLANHSSNGSEIAGRKVKGRPRPLPLDGTVSVAGVPLLRTTLQGYATTGTDEVAVEQEAGGGKKRTKLWVGIGIYLVIMLGIAAFFATLGEDDNGEGEGSGLTRLTESQIEELVAADLPIEPPSESAYLSNLRDARKSYEDYKIFPERIYDAYEAYRVAMSYNNGRLDESSDRIKYDDVRDQLTIELKNRYQEAYRRFRTRQWESAAEAFDEIRTVYYQDTQSEIFKNAGRYYAAAQQRKREER